MLALSYRAVVCFSDCQHYTSLILYVKCAKTDALRLQSKADKFYKKRYVIDVLLKAIARMCFEKNSASK